MGSGPIEVVVNFSAYFLLCLLICDLALFGPLHGTIWNGTMSGLGRFQGRDGVSRTYLGWDHLRLETNCAGRVRPGPVEMGRSLGAPIFFQFSPIFVFLAIDY